MDLHNCTALARQYDSGLKDEYALGPPVKTTSEQTLFFPLAVDDYFMSIAILSGKFSDVDKVRIICSF